MRKLTQEEFEQKARLVHGDKYGYQFAVYENSKINVTIYCNHCQKTFNRRPNDLLNGSGCKDCGYRRNAQARSKPLSKAIKDIQSMSIHAGKYDFSGVSGYKNSSSVIEVYCKACDKHFKTTASKMVCGYGCKRCSRRASTEAMFYTSEKFIRLAIQKHGKKYCYDHVNYVNSSTKVSVVCGEHGQFQIRPANHLQGQGCPKCAIDKQTGCLSLATLDESKESKPCIFYFIEFTRNDGTAFLKFGVTTRKVACRFYRCSNYGLSYHIIDTVNSNLKDCLILEKECSNKMKELDKLYRVHDLKNGIGGWTECITNEQESRDIINSIISKYRQEGKQHGDDTLRD